MKLDNFISRLNNGNEISKHNKKLLNDFSNQLIAEGISEGRVLKYLYHLREIIRLLKKDLDKASKKDIIAVVSQIERNPKWTAWTKKDFEEVRKESAKCLH
jgi:recombinational DNA repair protein RecT